MNQFNQPPKIPEKTREQKKQEYISLAQELSEAREGFPFPGINSESYTELKAVAEEFPEYSAQIDELAGRFQIQGMKIILRIDSKEVGHVYILPLNSQDAEMDNLFPRHLMMAKDIDERLKKLILLNKELGGK